MKQDAIIGALCGLVGATNNNIKTENTDGVVIDALAGTCAESVTLDKIHAEKFAISPNCATCAFPCGNTDDYDTSKIYNAPQPVKDAKLNLIAQLKKTAAVAHEKGVIPCEQDMLLFYKSIAYVSYDVAVDRLQQLTTHLQNLQKTLRGQKQ